LPKENPWQADGGLQSLEGIERNVYASRAWKGGNMKLGILDSTVTGTVLFCCQLLALQYPQTSCEAGWKKWAEVGPH